MKLFTICSLVFFLVKYPGYLQGQVPSQTVPEQTFRIDPTYARGGAASEVFEEVRYQPLETNKASLFNKIDKLVVTDEYFIILDDWSGSILVFKRNGDFHCRINELPGIKSPPPPLLINTFSVDRVKKEIIIRTEFSPVVDPYLQAKTLFYFDFDGNFLRKHRYDTAFSEFISLGNGRLILSYTSPGKEAFRPNTFYRLAFVKEDSVIYHKALPYRASHSGKFQSGSGWDLLGSDDMAIYNDVYDYSFYLVDTSGLRQIYRFIFPLSLSLPSDFLENSIYDGKRKKYIEEEHPEAIYALYDGYIQDNMLSFMTLDGFFDRIGYFYSPASGALLRHDRIVPDASNDYLPLFNELTSTILACDSSYFYSAVPSSEIHESYENYRYRDVSYPEAILNMVEDRMANPVIVMMKLKK